MIKVQVDAIGKVYIEPPFCCDHLSVGSYWPEERLPLYVKVTNKLMSFVAEQAIIKLNTAIGREVLRLKDPNISVRKDAITIEISMDKHMSAHGETVWESRWDMCSAGRLQNQTKSKKKAATTIHLNMRTKDNLSLRQKTFEYFSTLTHELIHCLGLDHFPSLPHFRPEIMFPRVGGTCIPVIEKEMENMEVTPEELPRLKRSPITILALQWCYDNKESKVDEESKRQRMPMYCGCCKQIGWMYL